MQHRSLLFVTILLGSLLVLPTATLTAQTGEGGWSIPAKLFEGEGRVGEPALAPDQTGILHAFWTYAEEGYPFVIYYARWDGNVWTQPVDVIAMPGVIQGPGSVVDQYGNIHLIWTGSGNTLYYSSAKVADAGTAKGWLSPVPLAHSNPHADIRLDSAGVLHLVYPGLLREGVYYMASTDGGLHWSPPTLVTDPVHPNTTTEFTRLAVAPNGDLHLVWTEVTLPNGAPSLGVYYAHSTDHGQSWSQPLELAGKPYLEANIVAVNQDVIHVAWNATGTARGRYHRWSSDGGNTWSQTNELASPLLGGGSTNPPALAVDTAETVHIVVNTSPSGDTAMYVFGYDNSWSPPLDISQGIEDYVGLLNEASALAITSGNVLSVLFVDKEGARLWHTWKISSAPGLAGSTFLVDSTRSSGTPVEARIPLAPIPATQTPATPTRGSATSSVSDIAPSRSTSTLPVFALIVGILPALLLTGGVVLLTLKQKRRH